MEQYFMIFRRIEVFLGLIIGDWGVWGLGLGLDWELFCFRLGYYFYGNFILKVWLGGMGNIKVWVLGNWEIQGWLVMVKVKVLGCESCLNLTGFHDETGMKSNWFIIKCRGRFNEG